MKKITINEAEFAELFAFAEEKFGKSWNECCAIFHRTEFLNYNNFTEFYLEDLERDENARISGDGWFFDEPRYNEARTIMIAFMKDNNVDECRIVG